MTKSRPGEDGFTLVELMTVVGIIAILIAFALPTFLGVQNRARDRGAQVSAALTLKTVRGVASDDPNGEFAAVTPAALNAAEPSRVFVDGATVSQSSNQVSVTVPDLGAGDQIFVAAVKSGSGTCFYARVFANAGADFARVSGADCKADNQGSAVFGPSW